MTKRPESQQQKTKFGPGVASMSGFAPTQPTFMIPSALSPGMVLPAIPWPPPAQEVSMGSGSFSKWDAAGWEFTGENVTAQLNPTTLELQSFVAQSGGTLKIGHADGRVQEHNLPPGTQVLLHEHQGTITVIFPP